MEKMAVAVLVLVLASCGGGGGGGSKDSVDAVVAHLNASAGAVYRGTTFNHYEPDEATSTDISCFNFPKRSRESFLDGRAVQHQSDRGFCLQGSRCYSINEEVLLGTSDLSLDVITPGRGHVIAALPGSSQYGFSMRVEERVSNEGDSCGNFDFTTFDDVNGSYLGRIYSVSAEGGDKASYRPIRSESISLLCSNDACMLEENGFFKAETGGNTYRDIASGGHVLRGAFRSKDDTTTFKFVGAASTSAKVVGGIAYPELTDEQALDCYADCLVLVFERQD